MSQTVSPVQTAATADPGLPAGVPFAASGDAFARARQLMVDGQVRPNQVNDARIVAAMRDIRRERFVPGDRQEIAYRDGDVPLGHGRFLTEPRVIARLIQAGAVRAGERVLVVGAATGYSAAILASLGADVIALESDPALYAQGESISADAGTVGALGAAGTIVWRNAALAAGAPGDAPFDLILIDGAVQHIPPALAAQLKPAGRLLAVIGVPGEVAYAALAEASASGLRPVPLFDAATKALPELVAPAKFTF